LWFFSNLGFAFDAADNQGNAAPGFYLSDGTHQALVRSRLPISLNQWHHLAVVFDHRDGRIRLFIGGYETLYSNWGGVPGLGDLTNSADLWVGRLEGEPVAFHGLIDELSIAASVLTAQQILWLNRAEY
jgi:hypothetical protein